MIDIDLTEAVEEAARDRYEATEHMTCWPSLAEASKRVWRSDVEGAVFAASSIIAKQVAEQIAAAIEAEKERARRGGYLIAGDVYDRLARIALEADR